MGTVARQRSLPMLSIDAVLQPGASAWSVPHLTAEQVVSLGEDVGFDLEEVPDRRLGRSLAAVDLRPNVLDDDPVGSRRFPQRGVAAALLSSGRTWATLSSKGAIRATVCRHARRPPPGRGPYPWSCPHKRLDGATLLPRERRDHQRLDGVQPILGLVEDDRGLRLEDVVGHLEGREAALLEDLPTDLGLGVVKGREAVHELHVGIAGRLHERQR